MSGFTRTSPATFALVITLSGGTALAQESAPTPAQPAQSSAPSQLVSDLFRPLGRDMRGMVSRDNLVLAGIGTLGAAASARFDTRATACQATTQAIKIAVRRSGIGVSAVSLAMR